MGMGTCFDLNTTVPLLQGYDTTAGTMGFVLMMLGIHPDVQQKTYEEISRVMSDLNGRELASEDLHKLHYLERVIKETLRLFPVGPLLFREASDDVRIGKGCCLIGLEP